MLSGLAKDPGVKLADVTPEFRAELQRLVSSGKFNVDSYVFVDGGVKAVLSTFAKLGDIPPAVVTKAIESLPVPQQRPAWEAAVSSMSDVAVLEGVSRGAIPFEFLAPALVPRLPAAVIYDHAVDVSNEVLIGALKGVNATKARDLIARLPPARQKAVWEAYIATLTPDQVDAGIAAGIIPAEYGGFDSMTAIGQQHEYVMETVYSLLIRKTMDVLGRKFKFVGIRTSSGDFVVLVPPGWTPQQEVYPQVWGWMEGHEPGKSPRGTVQIDLSIQVAEGDDREGESVFVKMTLNPQVDAKSLYNSIAKYVQAKRTLMGG